MKIEISENLENYKHYSRIKKLEGRLYVVFGKYAISFAKEGLENVSMSENEIIDHVKAVLINKFEEGSFISDDLETESFTELHAEFFKNEESWKEHKEKILRERIEYATEYIAEELEERRQEVKESLRYVESAEDFLKFLKTKDDGSLINASDLKSLIRTLEVLGEKSSIVAKELQSFL